jgi:HEAT repeat protein
MDRESLAVVMEQIDSGVFTTAWLAADMLGERGVSEAIAPLRRALDSPDPFLVGKAMVNLVRLGDTESYERIRRQFHESEHVRVVMYGGKAIARMADMGDLQLLLHKACGPDLPPAVKDEVLIGAASLCGAEDRYYRLIRAHRDDADAALTEALGELEDRSWGELAVAWSEGKRRRAIGILRELASTADERCSPGLTQFLRDVDPKCLDARASLCVVLLATSACGDEG